MNENDFNTFNNELEKSKENQTESKDKRKSLVVFLMIFIGQTMCILNTLINNFTIQTFKIQYPLLYSGGFYCFFLIIWMCINRKITEAKKYYFLIIILETQSFFFDYLSNYAYTFQVDSILKNSDSNNLFNNNTIITTSKKDDIDIKFSNSYPMYIYFPIQFILTFLIFIIFMRKKYYLQKKHFFALFLGIISVISFTSFYIKNYFQESLNLFDYF